MTQYKHKHNLSLYVNLRTRSLMATVLFTLSQAVVADDYFDPSFLELVGDKKDIDLSMFAKEGGFAEGTYTVSVFVNTHSEGVHTLVFKKNTDNIVAPLLTPALLASWGVNVQGLPGLRKLKSEQVLDNLNNFIPQSTVKLDITQLRLDISIPQIAMAPNYTGNADSYLWDDGIPAVLTNYSMSAGRNITRSSSGFTTHSNNLFATLRSGINTGPWRLRSTVTHAYSSNGQQQSSSDTHFFNTYLSRDIRPLSSTLILGESQTGSDLFDSIPFKGVILRSDEQMLPIQLQGYAPAITGVAKSNARVIIRQNGNIVYETYVAPGPFDIKDIQQSGMSGDYDVSVIEADGYERRFLIPYSTLPVMLRPGGWKYELAGGQYDGSLTRGTRRADFVLGTAVYGLPKGITLFGGALIAHDYQSVNAGSGISLGYVGAISADITHSNATFEEHEKKRGQSYRVRYSKSIMSTGTSVDLTALRYSTENYFSFSEYINEGLRREEGVNPWALQRRRSSFQTQLNQQMDTYGTLHLRYNRDGFWGTNKRLTGMSLGYSTSLKGVGIGLNYNIDRIKNDSNGWPENRQVSLNISVPFSIFGYRRDFQSMYATTSVMHDNHGKITNYAGLSGNMQNTNLNYSLNQSWGNQGQVSSSNANIGYQGSKGNVSAGYGYSNSAQSINMNLSGGMVIHSEGITLSSSVGDSIALVSAPDACGVSVSGNAAVIDDKGYAVVPYLSNYSRNSIGLDPTTLPDNVDLAQTNLNVYPTKGAVVKATFGTRVGHKTIITLTHQQSFVPFGSIVSLEDATSGQDISGIVGDNGQVYLAGLPDDGKLLVKWGGEDHQHCEAQFHVGKHATHTNVIIRKLTANCLSAQ